MFINVHKEKNTLYCIMPTIHNGEYYYNNKNNNKNVWFDAMSTFDTIVELGEKGVKIVELGEKGLKIVNNSGTTLWKAFNNHQTIGYVEYLRHREGASRRRAGVGKFMLWTVKMAPKVLKEKLICYALKKKNIDGSTNAETRKQCSANAARGVQLVVSGGTMLEPFINLHQLTKVKVSESSKDHVSVATEYISILTTVIDSGYEMMTGLDQEGVSVNLLLFCAILVASISILCTTPGKTPVSLTADIMKYLQFFYKTKDDKAKVSKIVYGVSAELGLSLTTNNQVQKQRMVMDRLQRYTLAKVFGQAGGKALTYIVPSFGELCRVPGSPGCSRNNLTFPSTNVITLNRLQKKYLVSYNA